MKKRTIMAMILILAVWLPLAIAAAPLDTVKANVDGVLEILRDPSSRGRRGRRRRSNG